MSRFLQAASSYMTASAIVLGALGFLAFGGTLFADPVPPQQPTICDVSDDARATCADLFGNDCMPAAGMSDPCAGGTESCDCDYNSDATVCQCFNAGLNN